jgi:hypothetical protein
MDEAAISPGVGQPIPEWDLKHRLPTDRPVGPDLWDGGTIFRINSTFMDVTEQPFMERQWTALAAFFSSWGVIAAVWFYLLTHEQLDTPLPTKWRIIFNLLAFAALAGFGWLMFKTGRPVFFALKNRPIRFNRVEKKLFAIRRRRFFGRQDEGDVVAEAAWNKDSIFCIHREATNFGRVYHIRHYKTDAAGNVVDAFSIGREWTGDANVRTLLAQWNYWCSYMNDGPATLPKPMLFQTTHETLRESFFFSMYTFGFTAGGVVRMITMPFTLLFAALRSLSLATCREAVWPQSVLAVSAIRPDDAYVEPSNGTPVGWVQTIQAQQRGEYPDSPKGKVSNWTGEADGVENAKRWLSDEPPVQLASA